MRLFPPLAFIKRSRAVPQEPVPYKYSVPLKLKQGVSNKGGKISEVCCIHEMSVMFSCLKDNEFQQQLCHKEVESFQKCYTSFLTDKNQRSEREMKGLLTPGEKRMTSKQLNVLLKKYPNLE
ncbi:unnamed protein product [Ceutorhynchus assimilis]|uniref:CHCH domain-containing protein n=1 Tax=Ceutorhynchus assimilis TaxID=467358 RepID=A0A9N9MPF3_9CUCU|nr:unnamed protein product [Ceutorhynchus assimilis]